MAAVVAVVAPIHLCLFSVVQLLVLLLATTSPLVTEPAFASQPKTEST
jgi:hypothetical protein